MAGKKQVIKDMALNIFSGAIPIVVLQLFILPNLSFYTDANYYGIIVTILAMMNTVPSSFGNVLNNVRLLHQGEYENKREYNDFPILLLIAEFINVILLLIAGIAYLDRNDYLGIILTVIMGAMWLAKEYHVVTFRLKIDYIKAAICNIFLSVGYVVGYGVFFLTNYWQFIYIIAFLCMYAYLAFNSDILLEKPKITFGFKKCIIDSIALIIAVVLARSISYADKMLLYPLLGGVSVSIYYAATVLGKVASLVVTPINSVALTYLSKYRKKPDDIFRWTVKNGVFICLIVYFASIVFGKPILNILYPKFADEAVKYIWITSGSIVVSTFTSMVTPFVLKFCNTKWQIIINLITTVIYVFLSLILTRTLDLMGFCVSVFLANLVKLIITLIAYYKFSL